MSYPSRQIIGNIFTPSGQVVVSGSVEARIIPAGADVLDTDGITLHKIAQRVSSGVNTTGIMSLALAVTDSAIPLDAYYQIHWQLQSPFRDDWYELWKVPHPAGSALSVANITPVGYGPYLPVAGYIPVQFGTGAPGPTGPPGGAQPTIVQSLPTIDTSLKGNLYYHDRSPNSLGDKLVQIMRTAAGSLVYIDLWEA